MNKETFLQAVTHPQAISIPEMEALEEVVENFPNCQLAHILIAKASHQHAGMLTSQKLRKAAAYAINRDALKKLVLGVHPENDDQQPLLPQAHSVADEPSQETNSSYAEGVSAPPEITLPLVFELPNSREDQLLKELESEAKQAEASGESTSRALEKKRQIEIIENFIKSQPRISSLRGDEGATPEKDLSEKSSSLSTKVVSESLAKIMVKQGKIEKAVAIYQELICKYPEKKAYFAGKIDELNANT
jgi:hypothetical protein